MKISNKVQMVFENELQEIYQKLCVIQEFCEDQEVNEAVISLVGMAMHDIEEIRRRPQYEVTIEVKMENAE